MRGQPQQEKDEREVSDESQKEEPEQAVPDKGLRKHQGKNQRQHEGGEKDRDPCRRRMGGGRQQGEAVGQDAGEEEQSRAKAGIGIEEVFVDGPPDERHRGAHRVRLVWRAPRCSL